MTNNLEIRSSESEIRKKPDDRSPKGPPRHAVVFARFRARMKEVFDLLSVRRC